jgi:Tol biopolymer transport system component
MRSNLKVPFFAKGTAFPLCWLGILICVSLLFPMHCFGRIYIDINAPAIRKFNIAIPDFKNLSLNNEHPELVRDLPGVISNDLDCSGYFTPMDKQAFLEDSDSASTPEDIRFKDWSVIGAELLLKGNYTCIGGNVEVEIRLFDVFWGRQILGKRALGDISSYRHLMHRLGNDVIQTLTGQVIKRFTYATMTDIICGKKLRIKALHCCRGGLHMERRLCTIPIKMGGPYCICKMLVRVL